ncbi:MAG: PIN domain-containing protein [Elainella sp. C42_A2020_010]|nr:PIN domain-containing protein [Elainella sp. C42_A2020_010]
MKPVFADASYWIALFNRNDDLHAIAAENTRIITREMVLTEFLNFFTQAVGRTRQQAANSAMETRQYPNITVIPQTTELFDRALNLYTQRPDKQWSLTDCSSFVLMQDLEIQAALTHDKHFEQAGFQVLMRKVTD